MRLYRWDVFWAVLVRPIVLHFHHRYDPRVRCAANQERSSDLGLSDVLHLGWKSTKLSSRRIFISIFIWDKMGCQAILLINKYLFVDCNNGNELSSQWLKNYLEKFYTFALSHINDEWGKETGNLRQNIPLWYIPCRTVRSILFTYIYI